MIDAVHRYDGYVVQSTGDGIFALFGAPVAHEDHPQRALYAGAADAGRVARATRRSWSPTAVTRSQCRVGVNTGEVVVRSIATGDGHTEYTPIGHTTNLASRMQAVAPTGSIAVSGIDAQALRGLLRAQAAGTDQGQRRQRSRSTCYEVIGLGPLRTRLQRSAGRGLTKFVGREREMDAMQRARRSCAKHGRGQIVAAMAEAGTGKSRLFFEFKAISQSGWMVLETFSVSHGKASAYLPVIDLLHGYFEILADDDERKRREKVTGTRARARSHSGGHAARTCSRCSESSKATSRWRRWMRRSGKRRTLDAIKRILLRESLNQPLMVIFEDLHWIDEETQALPEPARRLDRHREDPAAGELSARVFASVGISKTYYTQLRLDPLGKESADEMLSALLGDGAELAPLKRADHRAHRGQSVLHGRDRAGAARRRRAGAQRRRSSSRSRSAS